MTLADWLLADLRVPKGYLSEAEREHPWWKVMCLTGVDYFSTLGYQPGIAFLAAGLLSPLATLILVLVTLLAALPVYWLVAKASRHGQGSIAMLEKLFPQWYGKAFVLVLLGFATTDFIITITLSAADAAAHLRQNPFVPAWTKSQMGVTIFLLAILAAIFLKGFKEAIGVAVVLVGAYLTLNLVVTAVGLWHVAEHPELFASWKQALAAGYGSPWAMIGVSLFLFPKLALGLSGFETGVVVMPLIRGENLDDRVRNTHKLLMTAALIMSAFLIATSVVTTLLIEPDKFKAGGEANGRALAYLAHLYLGDGFGSLYDLSTILILAFAGASAMAGLLNLIPRYLPRFGMAPEWARAKRPLVLVFTAVGLIVTVLFDADVDAQGGAYATGVLALITSAAFAVTLEVWRSNRKWLFVAIAAVFTYTTALNIYERPEGLKISSIFILCMVFSSLISRAHRSTELRVTAVEVDAATQKLLDEDEDQVIRLIARRPRSVDDTALDLDQIDKQVRGLHNLSEKERIYFFEVEKGDASDFAETLRVRGECIGRHMVLRAKSPVVANSIAAMLIHLHKVTGRVPHGYLTWSDVSPLLNVIRFVFFGEGDTAPIAHEVLRRAIPDPQQRPVIHVG